ncbi:MAG: alpha-L-fucosidase [Candidatus Omnitrophota bacterium]
MSSTQSSASHDRDRRMRWWREARFGMFIHWGLYSQIARHEWVMCNERIPLADYERYADTWRPKPHASRAWARLAREAGMKYMVMTTKHLEGFCLWDTQQTDYNAVRRGPRRDLVREYIDACRESGLRVGLYYCLADWHHPDGTRCARDEAARRRFIEFTYACVRELMIEYGKIDILWFDAPMPLGPPERWKSERLVAMVRRLQPHILINDRSNLPEDFSTPEEHITPSGRDWEACMTFNGSWGWMPTPEEDWLPVRQVIGMLSTCAASGGNLLLNVGPKPDGTIPVEAVTRLKAVGHWLKTYGAVVYGKTDCMSDKFRVMPISFPTCGWSRKGSAYYFWIAQWPGKEFAIGGMRGELKKVSWVASDRTVAFRQERDRIVFMGLPEKCPDPVAGITLIKLEFKGTPFQQLGGTCEYLPLPLEPVALLSPYVGAWSLSQIFPKTVGWTTAQAKAVTLDESLGWSGIGAEQDGFVNTHSRVGNTDGYVYLANRFKVTQAGTWKMHVGHDGGVRVFVDGRSMIVEPESFNPTNPWRSKAEVKLGRGTHDVVIVFDLSHGTGWGIFFRWEHLFAKGQRAQKTACFPEPV